MITPAGAADETIMSSFLMNSGPYGGTDPKFLSSAEDYSQASAASAANNYMATQDYYAQHAAAAAGQYPGGYSMAASMGLNNHHQAAAGLTYPGAREHMAYGGGYYNHSAMTHQQMIQQQMMAQAGHLSPLNHSGTHLSGGARSPVASPQPQNNMGSNVGGLNHTQGGNGGHDGNGNSLCNSGGNGGSNDGDGYPSPSHPGVVSQPQLTPGGGGGGDGMSSDCSDDESSPSSGRQMPVVYPWMKKIHVGGVGKNGMLCHSVSKEEFWFKN